MEGVEEFEVLRAGTVEFVEGVESPLQRFMLQPHRLVAVAAGAAREAHGFVGADRMPANRPGLEEIDVAGGSPAARRTRQATATALRKTSRSP